MAFLALVLSYHEGGAPTWAWLNVLLAVALLRVLPEGRAREALRLYRWLALLLVTLLLVPFIVLQIRQALYPVLERPWESVAAQPIAPRPGAPLPARAAPTPTEEAADEAKVAGAALPEELTAQVAQAEGSGGILRRQRSKLATSYGDIASGSRPALERLDPNAKIQTGPGLPFWQWNRFDLVWSGPVESSQTLRLWLVSPAIAGILTLLRLALLVLLLARLARSAVSATQRPAAAGLLLLALGAGSSLLSAPPARAAEIPSPELIRELRDRLLAPPDCLPHCAEISRLRIVCSPEALQMRLEVHADADTAIPLPGGAQQWLPRQVLLDGAPASGLLRDGEGGLWLHVPKGVHQVAMEGSVGARDTVQLPLPLRPRHVEAELRGFSLDGLGADGEPGESLLLTRLAGKESRAAEEPAGSLPPFVRVERTLHLGLTWEIETRVARVGPSSAPVLVELPLLDGESVTHSEVPVEGGVARVNLGPQTAEVVFGSALKEQESLRLEAPAADQQIQVWRLDLGPQWHVTLDGIPVVSQLDQSARWLPEWRPWPGEKVTLGFVKPIGTEGQTLTLDQSVMSVTPGIRSTDATLTLSLRSSRGEQHALKLPDGAILQRVAIDGQVQPIRLEAGRIELPVHPGAQVAEVVWREPRGMTARFRTSSVDVGMPGVNGSIQLQVPEGRWLLLLGGPKLGPAVLFWSVLIALALVAFGLGRVPLTPLRAGHWFLLFLGLTQSSLWIGSIIVGWFLLSGLRRRFSAEFVKSRLFQLGQLALVAWTAAALVGVFVAVERGLLGQPEMQVMGNGSHYLGLQWYQDRTPATLPTAWVLSIPLLVYRVLMLAWALWLAFSLVRWLRWGWECFSDGGYWRKIRIPAMKRPASPSPPPSPVAGSEG